MTLEEGMKKFPVGSKARVINAQGTHNFVEGDIVTVMGHSWGETEGSGERLFVKFEGVSLTYSPSRFEPVVEEIGDPKESVNQDLEKRYELLKKCRLYGLQSTHYSFWDCKVNTDDVDKFLKGELKYEED
jgi:hypothetical protein